MKVENYFGFKKTIFPKVALGPSIFKYPELEQITESLLFALERETIAMLVAESGCGKSTALRQFVKNLDAASYNIINLSLTTLKPFSFISLLATSSGLSSKRFKGETAAAFLFFLRAQTKRAVILIDEAQLLPDNSLEDLRLLTCDNFAANSAFDLILVGQPLLRERIAEPQHCALAQRIGVRLFLRPLNEKETTSFLVHHLNAVGSDGRTIFEPNAVAEIFRHSRGIPRLIQNIALNALLAAMAAGKQTVNAEIIQHSLIDAELL